MPKAVWNGTVIAESERTQVVEGNQYFPPDAVRREHLRESSTHTTCPWKGVASYYDVVVGNEVNKGRRLVLPGDEGAPRTTSAATSRSGAASPSSPAGALSDTASRS
jgi:hypothetical protein